MYSAHIAFCLRYTLGGKRRWEQLSVSTYKEAQAASLKRLSDLITEECGEDFHRGKDQQEPRAPCAASAT